MGLAYRACVQRGGSGQDRASGQLLDSFNGQTCGKQGTWVFKYIPAPPHSAWERVAVWAAVH